MEGLGGFIERDKERKRKQKAGHREITLREYLELVAEDPAIAQGSPARIHEIIMDAGVVELPENERVDGIEVSYLLFDEELFGIRKTIYEIVRHFIVGANRGSTSKQILALIIFRAIPAAISNCFIVKLTTFNIYSYLCILHNY